MQKKIKLVFVWMLIGVAFVTNVAMFSIAGILVIVGRPYWRPIAISNELRQSFSMSNFLGEEYGTERVMLLGEEPGMALVHRLELISRATESIYVTTYLVQRTPTADIFFEALFRAADRGITVNFLIDGLSNSNYGNIDPDIRNALSGHPNISFHEFNNMNIFRPRDINKTMHDKIFIVDQRYMILGGMNIGDQYWDFENWRTMQSRHANNIDSEVLVYNTDTSVAGSIIDARNYVRELINHRMARTRPMPTQNQMARGIARRVALSTRLDGFVERTDIAAFDYYQLTVPTKRITLLTNPIDSRNSQPVIAYNLLRLAEHSDRVYVATPYIVLLNRDRRALAEVAANTEIIFATNSTELATGIRMNVHNFEMPRNIASGVRVYEFQSYCSKIHSKHMVFDDRLSAIGSLNIEVNSFYFDTESMLVIDSVEFNAKLAAKTHGYIEQSTLVEQGRSGGFWKRARGWFLSGFKWLI